MHQKTNKRNGNKKELHEFPKMGGEKNETEKIGNFFCNHIKGHFHAHTSGSKGKGSRITGNVGGKGA